MSRIRITGGEWRSRLISVQDAVTEIALRPTPDRVREALFNWLGHDLRGLSCLDLFAGSGILGFEAASRGAESVVMIEKDRKAFAALKKNAASFDCERLKLHCADALKFAPISADGRFDLVFLDPPYGRGILEQIAPRLEQLAKPSARLYVEAETALESLGDFVVTRQGHAGQVFFHLLEHR
ncbi:MAG: 16S rRNA (guanine(966)-N(2))-methyltransferase RsmD [Rhodocyclaceae bacterium]|nr:16S rRNA (guanine(966)-N(2))-methyltransferase RsmD [Rhodocyclaceae bacterium]